MSFLTLLFPLFQEDEFDLHRMLFAAGGSSDCDDDNAVMCWKSCTVGPVCGQMEQAYCVDTANNEVVDGTIMCPSAGDETTAGSTRVLGSYKRHLAVDLVAPHVQTTALPLIRLFFFLTRAPTLYH